MTPSEFLDIKNFKPKERVFVVSKGYPVLCEVIEKKTKGKDDGYSVKILDDGVIKELGADHLWLPCHLLDKITEA